MNEWVEFKIPGPEMLVRHANDLHAPQPVLHVHCACIADYSDLFDAATTGKTTGVMVWRMEHFVPKLLSPSEVCAIWE